MAVKPKGKKYSNYNTRPRVTALQMALARDEKKGHNKYRHGALGFNHMTSKRGKHTAASFPKWLA